MNKKYLNYLFKSKKTLIMYIAIIELLLAIAIRAANYHDYNDDVAMGGLATFAIISFGLSIVLPIYMIRFIHSKKMSDTYFSLPMTRKELLTSTFIFEFVTISLPLIITSIFVSVGVASKFGMHYGYLPLLLVIELFALFVSLAVNTVFSLLTNTTLDALVINVAHHALPFVVMLTIWEIADTFVYGYSPVEFENLLWLSWDVQIVRSAILGFDLLNNGIANFNSSFIYVISLIYTFIVGVFAVYLSYKLLDKRKVEMAEEKSNDFFAYPLIRHIFAACIIALIVIASYINQEWTTGFILILLVAAVYIASGFLYERKIVVKKSNIIFLIVITLVSTCLSYVGVKTKGLGFSYGISRNFDSIEVSYYDYGNMASDDYLGKYNEYRIVINLKKEETNEEFFKDLENIQKPIVDHYYENGYEGENNTSLSIRLKNKYNVLNVEYYYSNFPTLSDDEIEILKKYGDLFVEYYDEEKGTWVQEIVK